MEIDSDDNAVSAIDLIHLAFKAWKLTVLLPVIGASLAMALSYAFQNVYTGTARFLPPQGGSSQALAFSFSNAAGISPLLSNLGLKNPGDMYVGIARGTTVSDRIIGRFNLRALYEQDTLTDTRRALTDQVAISSSREGIVSIEVEDTDPQRAADIANAYLEELTQLLSEMSTSEAAYRREFFARQLKAAQTELTQAEDDMRRAQEQTGVLALSDQGRMIIESIARLRAQISAANVELEAMKLQSTTSNPEYQKRVVGVRELQKELRRLETSQNEGTGNVFVATGRLPELGMIYLRKLRDLKYHEAITEILARQYELARIEEARDNVPLQIIDKATPPDKRTRPKRTLIGVITFFAIAILSMAWLYARAYFQIALRDPQQRRKWDALRKSIPVPWARRAK